MIRDVLRMGDPRLWQPSVPVDRFGTRELDELLQDLRDTMAAYNGAGLAAPQIGVGLRVVIFGVEYNPRYPDAEPVPYTELVNPVLTPLSDEKEEGWEGCLSVPGLRGWVERPDKINVRGFNEQAQKLDFDLDGYPAIVMQHECDHLDGVLYVDRIEDKAKFAFEEEANRYLDTEDFDE